MTQGRSLSVDDVLNALNDCLRHNGSKELSPQCRALLAVLWQQPHLSYPQLVKELAKHQIHVSVGHLRNVSAELWKTLGTVTNAQINKQNVVDELRRWYDGWHAQGSLQLYGRDHDIANIMRQLQSGQYQVLCITGIPTVGKTELIRATIRRLDRQIASSSTVNFLWFDAEEVCSVQQLLSSLQQRVTYPRNGRGDSSNPIDTLLSELRENRIVIVLNDADVLYEANQYAGVLSAGSGYERLLNRMVEDPTIQGGLVWVSRVLPDCLEEDRITLYKYPISPLPVQQSLALLESRKALLNSRIEWSKLIEFCGSIPGLLLAATKRIDKSFGGRIREFIQHPLRDFSDASSQRHEANIWYQLIDVLVEDEQIVLGWLMLQPMSHRDISEIAIPRLSQSQRTQALQSLIKRGLVREESGFYHLYPAYFRYVVANWLIQHMSQHIQACQLLPLLSYVMILPSSAAWMRHWHHHYVLAPFWNLSGLTEQLRQLLQQIQHDISQLGQPLDYACAVGTLLNIAVVRQIPLSALNITGLTIRCADLSEARLAQANLTNCVLQNTRLPISFAGDLVADISADSHMIAVGDSEGRVGVWARHQEEFRLENYHRFRHYPNQSYPVQRVTFSTYSLSIAVRGNIYRWPLASNDNPEYLMTVEDEVSFLLEKGDCFAVGLTSGSICLKDLFSGDEIDRVAHGRPIRILALDNTDCELASISDDDSVLLWNVQEISQIHPVGEIPTDERIVQAAVWQAEELLLAALLEGQPFIKRADQPWQTFPTVSGLRQLVFSRNGQFLLGIDDHGALYRWHQDVLEPLSVVIPGLHPLAMVLTDDGDNLLTVSPSHRADKPSPPQVQLWQVSTGRLLWELRTVAPASLNGVLLTNIRGLTDAHRRHIREFTT